MLYCCSVTLYKHNQMNNVQYTEGQAKFCGAALLGLLTYCAFPHIIPAIVGAALGYLLVGADLNLPGPRDF
jgi:hypothetical protein